MKGKITLLLLAIPLMAVSQFKFKEAGFSYSYSNPTGLMHETINGGHGVLLDFYMAPKDIPVALGMEVSYNIYGQNKTTQEYTFDNGIVAPMDIVVSNNFTNVLLAGRYYLLQGRMQPYLSGKLGYSFYFTSLNIYDPNEMDQCAPIDSDRLYKDGSWIGSIGGGVQWDIRKEKNPGFLMLNLSVNLVQGGRVSYMNVDAPNHNHATHTSDVYARFINTQTQVVHEHHVGNVYTSWVQMMDFRLGLTIRPGTIFRF